MFLPVPRMKSLSRNFLLSVGITSISITLLGSIAAFVAYRNDLAARQMTHLREYVEQRQRNVSRRFGSIAGIQQAARTKLTADMDRLSDADIDRLIERDYPRQADGTRRSRPEAFDGVVEPNGDIISGIGAFLSPGLIPADEKRAMVAAFHVVHHFGVGVQSSYDNFYFVTPNNRVVLFAPNRPDRLLFYRKTAPASLDFSREEMMTMIGPAKNPLGRTRCTSLQRLIQDPEGRRLATACLTPVTYKGRFVGAFGSSLQMGNYMPAAVGAQIEDVTSLLVRGEGSVIAYPGQQPGEPASTETLTKVERDFHVRELMRRIQAKKQDSGVIGSHSGRNIVGFAHIPEPDWWVLLAYSEADVRDKAFRSASWILVLGLAASLLQTALIVWLARRTIALPLRRLTDTRQTDALPPDLLRRRDEIGALGRALGDERAKTQALLTSLEERVVARTAELRRASSEKDRFLANMSHELRTPLNGVIAVSETLAQLQRSRRGKEMAHLIVQSSRLLEHVLSDILDVSRLDAGRIVPGQRGLRAGEGAGAHRRAPPGRGGVQAAGPAVERRPGGGRRLRRRSRATDAGGLQPPLQRGQVHRARRGSAACGVRRRTPAPHGSGHRHRLRSGDRRGASSSVSSRPIPPSAAASAAAAWGWPSAARWWTPWAVRSALRRRPASAPPSWWTSPSRGRLTQRPAPTRARTLTRPPYRARASCWRRITPRTRRSWSSSSKPQACASPPSTTGVRLSRCSIRGPSTSC